MIFFERLDFGPKYTGPLNFYRR